MAATTGVRDETGGAVVQIEAFVVDSVWTITMIGCSSWIAILTVGITLKVGV